MDPELNCEEEVTEDDDLEFVAAAAFAFFALERLSQTSLQRRRSCLVRSTLQTNPRLHSAWQALYRSRNDGAFIVTMGIDCRTFDYILQSGFTQRWNTHPIFRDDVEEHAITRPNRRSLDAAGGLALILHYLNSTMAEVTLQQVFSLVPAVCCRYLIFALHQLLSTLGFQQIHRHHHPSLPFPLSQL